MSGVPVREVGGGQGEGGMVSSPRPQPARVQDLEERLGRHAMGRYISPVITHVLVDRNRAGIEATGDQTVAAIRELPDMGLGDKDKDSSDIIGALSKKVHGAGSQRDSEPGLESAGISKRRELKLSNYFCQSIICFVFLNIGMV